MKRPPFLYRTMISIWTEYPTDFMEPLELARDVASGEAFCEVMECEKIVDQYAFPDTEFFDLGEPE